MSSADNANRISCIQGKYLRAGIRSGGICLGFLDCNAGIVSDHARNGILAALKNQVTIAGLLDRLRVFQSGTIKSVLKQARLISTSAEAVWHNLA